jgi:crotonobetainyl-CoA:carnitine CoA-transferase CaiB-like acyl-CoA transferase
MADCRLMDTEDARALDAQSWAAKLVLDLGADVSVPPAGPSGHPALSWAECGAMALTGHRDGPPLMCPVPLAACADGALLALAAIAQAPDGVLPRGGGLLAERAAMTGLGTKRPRFARRRLPTARLRRRPDRAHPRACP